ncbi:thiopeptide-type bacteriocin biosynthesis protein [Frankia sp. AgB1.9]|uniref:thiopeptide-type bacteriocin biosynthesis protein n=1 Tax=unclassified Frankia TaxID=2632575 RepID=UPI0019328984|nr:MULTISPECIES: thiopeptide-type bacteriocin biosynthesis protein [unclassified Frankia]MBL7489729.1 thiopeptide-type bacteriocin biosynthesis protein [Frankia sp. AgW1.1]MBL7551939.1 thiopeptide-type bacteriocin biosynthesis protein [Frankia sp. AgB1.9]MBL7623222.1 thiopeptide-type bacteriocin biosynthesis protein [Frankia sp. AgB1.8]
MHSDPWRQLNVAFPDWSCAELTAVAHLGPLLTAAEDDGRLDAWFFIRKAPYWRIRYSAADPTAATTFLRQQLEMFATTRAIEGIAEVVYEPETHVFGGGAATVTAHRLFHSDSRHLLAQLADPPSPAGGHRRELAFLVCTALLRAAGLDWYEQGDVWARVAEHRKLPDPVPGCTHPGQAEVEMFLAADPDHLSHHGGPLAFAAAWIAAHSTAGRHLATLAAAGTLHRGLRAVVAHHVLFTWNRHGLPYATQGVLARTATSAVFGPDPASQPPRERTRP